MIEKTWDGGVIVVYQAHCIFRCGHAVDGVTPADAHQLMEAHYADRHGPAIAALAGGAR